MGHRVLQILYEELTFHFHSKHVREKKKKTCKRDCNVLIASLLTVCNGSWEITFSLSSLAFDLILQPTLFSSILSLDPNSPSQALMKVSTHWRSQVLWRRKEG